MTLVPIGPPRFDPEKGPPCHDCTARCCKYFALEIDRPTTPRQHDYIRWYLLHRQVVVWVQRDRWYLEVRTPCRHLLPNNDCAIYHTRPQICRDYGWPEAGDTDAPCEYFTGEGGYELFFDSPEAFDRWSEVALRKREERLAHRRARERKTKSESGRKVRRAIA